MWNSLWLSCFCPCQKGLQALRWASRCSSRCPSRCAIHNGYRAWTFPQMTGWPRFGSVWLRFGDGTVQVVPVFGSGGSSKECLFLCVFQYSLTERTVPVPVSVPGKRFWRFWFRVRFLGKRFRRFRFPVPVRFLGHPAVSTAFRSGKEVCFGPSRPDPGTHARTRMGPGLGWVRNAVKQSTWRIWRAQDRTQTRVWIPRDSNRRLGLSESCMFESLQVRLLEVLGHWVKRFPCDQNLATGKYGCTEVRVYPTECGEQLGTDPSKIGSSKSLVLKSFSGEGTLWDSSLPVSLTLWDTPALSTPPLPLPRSKCVCEWRSSLRLKGTRCFPLRSSLRHQSSAGIIHHVM